MASPPASQSRGLRIPVALIDPLRVRRFAKAQGILAKTDRLDARVLALFAAMMNPSLRAPAPQTMAELAELVVARASAVEAQTALKNQHGAAEGKFLKRQLERRIDQSRQGYRRARSARSSDASRPTSGLARRYVILTSIPSFDFAARRDPHRLSG